jgi:hypothetical protein
MSDGTDRDQRQESPSRTMTTHVCGDTADEIELAALTKAREAFGPYRLLSVIPSYRIYEIDGSSTAKHRESGKRFDASVIVRAEDDPA